MLIGKARRNAGAGDQRVNTVSLSFNGTDEDLSNLTEHNLGIANTWSVLVTAKTSDNTTLNRMPIFWTNRTTGEGENNEILIQRIVDFPATDEQISVAIRSSDAASLLAYRWFNAFLPLGTWRTHVFTFSGGTSLLGYIDGTLKTVDEITSNNSVTMTEEPRIVYIGGNDQSPREWWNGNIAQVAMWNRVLTASEAAAMCAAPNQPMVQSGLVHWWRCGLPTTGSQVGSTYITDAVDSGGIDLSVDAENMSAADIVSDVP